MARVVVTLPARLDVREISTHLNGMVGIAVAQRYAARSRPHIDIGRNIQQPVRLGRRWVIRRVFASCILV